MDNEAELHDVLYNWGTDLGNLVRTRKAKSQRSATIGPSINSKGQLNTGRVPMISHVLLLLKEKKNLL